MLFRPKILVPVILFLLPLLSFAQLRVSEYPAQQTPIVSVAVRDSITAESLPGAILIMVSANDTLKTATADDGMVSFMTMEFASDTVEILTSFVGYKSRRDVLKIPRHSECRISIGLQEDSMMLNEIIVRGNAVAMVVHGDTTIFNSAAFPSMKGDLLKDLLEKFPGVTISGGRISYNGQNIDRLLFNGNNLFGKDMENAMNMVLSKEVKSVDIYDRVAVNDLNDDGTEAKERVMDVHTWTPLKHVGELKLETGAGIFTSRNKDGKYDWRGDGGMNVGNYVLGTKPRIHGRISVSHNPVDVSRPTDRLAANVGVGRDVAGRGGYQFDSDIKIGNVTSSDGSVSSYRASDIWIERLDTSSALNCSGSVDFSLIGGGYYKKGKDSFTLSSSFLLSCGRAHQKALSKSRQDGVLLGYDKTVHDTSISVNYTFRGKYTRSFSKKRRSLTVQPYMKILYKKEAGSRLDTLSSSIVMEWLTNRSSSFSINPGMDLKWMEPVGRHSMVTVGAVADYDYGTDIRVYHNMLTGYVDNNNTRDYDVNKLKNTVYLAYRFGRKNDGFYAELMAGVRDVFVTRSENVGSIMGQTKNYVRPDVSIDMTYTSGEELFSLKYDESESVPSPYQLRNAVDDINPLLLRSGNPNLKMSVKRAAQLNYGHSFTSYNANLTLNCGGNIVSNLITTRTEYFSGEAFLEEYNYTMPAGSSIIFPVNVSYAYETSSSIKYEQFFSRIKSNVEVDLSAGVSGIPFYVGGDLYRNACEWITISTGFRQDSENHMLILAPQLSLGRHRTSGEVLFGYLTPQLRAEYKQRIGDHFELHFWGIGSRMFSTPKGFGYLNLDINSSMSVLFGKDNRCRLSVYAMNLTDSVKQTREAVEADRVIRSYENNLGRSAGLAFTYVFSRR